MDNKSDEQLLIMQATNESKNQDLDEKTKKPKQDLTGMIASMMDQTKISKYSLDKKYSPKAQDTNIVVPS